MSSENSLYPRRWKSYDDKLKQYQGEFKDKRVIHKNFREFLKNEIITQENAEEELPELKK